MRPVRRLLGRVFLVTALLALGLVAVPAVTTLADPATGVSYSYDAAGHLASVTTVDGSAVYHYDADGNITSCTSSSSRRSPGRWETP